MNVTVLLFYLFLVNLTVDDITLISAETRKLFAQRKVLLLGVRSVIIIIQSSN